MSAEAVREHYRQQGRSDDVKSSFNRGFHNGKMFAFTEVILHLNTWYEQGDIIELSEMMEVMNDYYEKAKEQVSGGLAQLNGMEQGKDLCQDCSGPGMCGVCERVDR